VTWTCRKEILRGYPERFQWKEGIIVIPNKGCAEIVTWTAIDVAVDATVFPYH
jgi:hypothetical protein